MVGGPIRAALIFLFLAFASNRWQVVQALCDLVDEGGRSHGDHPLLREEKLRKLLQRDGVSQAELNLLYGARDGNIENVKAALRLGAKGDKSTPTQRFTPLIFAARGGYKDIVDILVESGINVNAQTRTGMTALWSSAFHGHLAVVQTLVNKGEADVDLPNINSTTPLFVACQHGHSDVVKFLLRKGADPRARSDTGATPLLVASQAGRPDIVAQLAEQGADVNVYKDESGQSALWSASFLGHLDVVQVLIEHGASVNFQAEDGSTPLYAASQQGWPAVVSKLVEEGANVDLASRGGLTPLHIAVIRGHADVVKVLIDAGADITVEDGKGQTAADVVKAKTWTKNSGNNQGSMLAMLKADSSPEEEPLPPERQGDPDHQGPSPKSPSELPQKKTPKSKAPNKDNMESRSEESEVTNEKEEPLAPPSSGLVETAPSVEGISGGDDEAHGKLRAPEQEVRRTHAVEVVGQPPRITILEAEDSILHNNGQEKHLMNSGEGVSKANVAIITVALMVSVVVLVIILSIYAVKRRKASESKQACHQVSEQGRPDQHATDEGGRALRQTNWFGENHRETHPGGGFESDSFDWPQRGNTPQRDAMESRRSNIFLDGAAGGSNPLSMLKMHAAGMVGAVPERVRTWNWMSDDRPSTEQPSPSTVCDENVDSPKVYRNSTEDFDSSPFHDKFSWNEKLTGNDTKRWPWLSFWRGGDRADGQDADKEGGQCGGGSKSIVKVVSATSDPTESARDSQSQSDSSIQPSPGLQAALERAQGDSVFYAGDLHSSDASINESTTQFLCKEVLERQLSSPHGASKSLFYNGTSNGDGGGIASPSAGTCGNGCKEYFTNSGSPGDVTKVSGSCVRMTADEGAGTSFPGVQGDRGRRKIRILYKD